jgi:EAL domain-containing protein (putative c-di-GMP-specific phosphodiesterase class I)
MGYEALGRGIGDDGERMPPNDLFELASALDREAELSDSMRDEAIRTFDSDMGEQSELLLFVNTHPAELKEGVEPLLDSLERWVRKGLPCRLVLEIHEAAVASPTILRRLAEGLIELDIDLAFDDFGTGQARLLELVEVAPRFLKFDRAWVSGIDQAPPARRSMMERMVTLVRELGVATLAEGVETAAEAEVCRQMGFELGQGWFYGRPEPLPG